MAPNGVDTHSVIALHGNGSVPVTLPSFDVESSCPASRAGCHRGMRRVRVVERRPGKLS
jgi:hypothetical protein